jgi:hypothetical protein
MTEDRDAYLQKCKSRALEYLPDVQNAIASLISDLRRHEDFVGIVDKMTPLALHYAITYDIEGARRFITGFR